MGTTGHWIIAECGAHAKGGELLREAAARPGPRAAGQGPPGTLPEEILWQERLCDAYVYSGWVPQCLFAGLYADGWDAALVHVIGGLIALGYAQNYYFHLRMFPGLAHTYL
jgi:hypothetical protein